MNIIKTTTLVEFEGIRYVRIQDTGSDVYQWRKVVDKTTIHVGGSELEKMYQKTLNNL